MLIAGIESTLTLPLSLSKGEATRLHTAQLANRTSNIEHRTPKKLDAYRTRFATDRTPRHHAAFDKGPTIHSSAWVVPGATVWGRNTGGGIKHLVRRGAAWRHQSHYHRAAVECSGQRHHFTFHTNYPTTVGELVTVGHTAVVHACTIDNEVLVGMGAIILDDVEVGARSIIGAERARDDGNEIRRPQPAIGSPAKSPGTNARRAKRHRPVGMELRRNGKALPRILLEAITAAPVALANCRAGAPPAEPESATGRSPYNLRASSRAFSRNSSAAWLMVSGSLIPGREFS